MSQHSSPHFPEFPPKSDTVSQALDRDECKAIFLPLWERVRSCFFKLERAQAYREPEDPSYQAFVRGDMTTAKKELAKRIAAQATLYQNVLRNGIGFIRIRIVERPLSDYLRYEFLSYPMSARLGERIGVLDITGSETLRHLAQAGDFNLFDAFAVVVYHYDDGLLKGGWLIEKPEAVQRYVSLAKALQEQSVPLGVFEREQRLWGD